ncbi:hypothetical protein CC86DRAFT_366209 [Ophiobolus disseminans]|uniref:BTB domain-containing protein n=1 Tax=Ophiobolus disseminans TaxID=1469910 RepID=A0A6A7AGQ6_9PLEO|nr:hypothetical protein CC86DRAFT_366209 [Ophiobolus disseminans]
METEITLQYGTDFKQSRVIHEEILSCHSQAARELFKRAKTLRDAYPVAHDLRKQLKGFILMCGSEKQFEASHSEKEARAQITHIYEHYPIPGHRNAIQLFVDEAIAEQVNKKNIIGPTTKNPLQKKDLKGMGIQLQLQSLNSKAVWTVTERLVSKLREIKHKERKDAKSSSVKAAAQHRIILPNTEDRVVRSLVQWIYCQGALNYDDAEHLYALRALATRLGMTELETQCLSKLATDTEDMIRLAISQGLTLQEVLGLGAEPEEGQQRVPASNLAEIVFQHVLTDKISPKRLLALVVRTLAEHLEPGLWRLLEPKITPTMSLRIIKAMLDHRQIKTDEAGDASVKSESVSTGDEHAMFALNEQT